MVPSLDDAREARDQARQGNLRDNEAGIPDEQQIDYEEATVLEANLLPATIIGFDHVARVSINAYGNGEDLLGQTQNFQNAGPQKYGFDATVTLADPYVDQGTIWYEDGEYPTAHIIGDPDSENNPYELDESVDRDEDGEVVGASVDGVASLPGGQGIEADQVDSLDALDVDYLELSVGGARGRNLLGVLDTAGEFFTDADGNVVEGLFEAPVGYFSTDYDGESEPRLTGYPELRGDLVGQAGYVSCLYPPEVDEPDTRTRYEINVHTDEGDDEMSPALTSPRPGDPAYALPTYPRSGNTIWQDGDSTTAPADAGQAEPENNGGVAEAKAMVAGEAQEADDEITVDDLSPAGKEFVDNALEAMAKQGMNTTDEIDDFEERFAKADAEDDFAVDADTMADLIDGERGN